MNCPLCLTSDPEIFHIRKAFMNHLNFETIEASGKIGRCSLCNGLFNVIDRKREIQVGNLFKSKTYTESLQTGQTYIVDDYEGPQSRSFLQAELLYRFIRKKAPNILDIGCFHGELLSELDLRFEKATLHGMDINKNNRSYFPKKDNFHFWSTDLGRIDIRFDLICLSHSVMYIRDIQLLMRQIKDLLKPDGILFIQTPDISKNPCYLLMGDQYYFYTSIIMGNMLKHFGLGFSSIESKWFPRDVVGFSRPLSRGSDGLFIEDPAIHWCINSLNNMERKLKKISNPGRIAVLGTAVNAAFVDSILFSRVTFFIDENPNRIGSRFRGKEVRHPRFLEDSDLHIIPYGRTGKQIRDRFKSQYKGQHISI